MIGINQFEIQGIAVSSVENFTYKNGNGQYGIFYVEVQEGDKKTMYGITLFGKSYERYALKVNKGDAVYAKGRIVSSQFTSRSGDRKLSYTLSANWIETETEEATQETYGGQTFDTGKPTISPDDLPF